MDKERRGLRFVFSADAEIAPQSAPSAFVRARVKELSLRGCFLETPASFEMQRPVLVKIYSSGEYFEAEASVLHVQPSGVGLLFREIKPHFRAVLQNWILAALDKQTAAGSTIE
jgi:PilZ domain-containing protein